MRSTHSNASSAILLNRHGKAHGRAARDRSQSAYCQRGVSRLLLHLSEDLIVARIANAHSLDETEMRERNAARRATGAEAASTISVDIKVSW